MAHNVNGSDNDDESYNENNGQQQLPEGFANSFFKIVTPILLQITFLPSASTKSTVAEYFYLLKMWATVWETRTTYFKKEPLFLIDQPRACCIFMLCSIKTIILHQALFLQNKYILSE